MKKSFIYIFANFVSAVAFAQHPHSHGGSPFYWAIVGAIAYGGLYILYLLFGYIIKYVKNYKKRVRTSNIMYDHGPSLSDSYVMEKSNIEDIQEYDREGAPDNDKNKQVYCRYCGKQIDEDAIFCPRCGKRQNSNNMISHINQLGNIVKRLFNRISDSFRQILNATKNTNYSLLSYSNFKKWIKRLLFISVIMIGLGLLILFSLWLFGVYKTSEWSKNDECRELIAMQDITKADSIARELFEEYAKDSHRYDFDGSKCGFDHINRGIEIIRNAAEKGNAHAQFTLGCIYAGARYDSKYERWGSYTMMNTDINHERAAYWYNQAAIQGDPTAMGNLANSYRYGEGVEKNLLKATELMKSAAENGNSWAQLNYGDMFRDGDVYLKVEKDSVGRGSYVIHVKPNIERAKEWWTKALNNGNNAAKERLEKIY